MKVLPPLPGTRGARGDLGWTVLRVVLAGLIAPVHAKAGWFVGLQHVRARTEQ